MEKVVAVSVIQTVCMADNDNSIVKPNVISDHNKKIEKLGR